MSFQLLAKCGLLTANEAALEGAETLAASRVSALKAAESRISTLEASLEDAKKKAEDAKKEADKAKGELDESKKKGGTLKIKTSGIIAKGARVTWGAGGKAVTQPTAAGTYRTLGRKLTQGNSADGDIIEILDVIERVTVA
ncbi:MAG: hypothetical protein QM680_07175 [Luteolibacter sp.]